MHGYFVGFYFWISDLRSLTLLHVAFIYTSVSFQYPNLYEKRISKVKKFVRYITTQNLHFYISENMLSDIEIRTSSYLVQFNASKT